MNKFKRLIAVMLTMMLVGGSLVWAESSDDQEPQVYTDDYMLRQKEADENMVEIEWENMEADHYEIEWADSPSDWENAYLAKSENAYVSIYDMAAGSSYYVRVRAVFLDYGHVEEISGEEENSTDIETSGEKITTVITEKDLIDDSDMSEKTTLPEREATYLYGNWSETIEVVTAPKKPENIVQTDATKNSISIKWKAVKGAQSYNIYKKTSGVTKYYANVSGTVALVDGLKKTDKTDIIVAAVRSSDNGFTTENYSFLSNSKIKLMPSKVTGIKVVSTNKDKNKLTISFDRQTGMSGAQLQLFKFDGKKPFRTEILTSNVKTMKNIRSDAFYKIRIRAYTKINGKKRYGAWSDYFYFGQQTTVSLSFTNMNELVVQWNAYKGASKYEVYVSSNNKNFVKVASTKNLEAKLVRFSNKAINKSKAYYIYVKAIIKTTKNKFESAVMSSTYLQSNK